MLKWMYRDNGDDRFRVWRNDWGGDSFVVWTHEAFATFRAQCMELAIPLLKASDDD